MNILKNLKALKPIDINQCKKISDVVFAMSQTAIGARMLGENTLTLVNWLKKGKKPIVIIDDLPENLYFQNLVRKIGKVMSGKDYIQNGFFKEKNPVIAIGYLLNQTRKILFKKDPNNIIFINNLNLAPPWVKDGYFKSFLNANPQIVLPVIYGVLEEKIFNRKFSFKKLLNTWLQIGGEGKNVAMGFEVLLKMIKDKNCKVVMTLSGIMTMAKMSSLIAYMIEKEWVNILASTGALIGHGLVEGVDLKHYKYDPKFSDVLLAKQKLNRITDTIEPEKNLDHIEKLIHNVLTKEFKNGGITSPSEIIFLIGKYLFEKYPSKISILTSAYKKNVPIFIPAFYDSELGNDVIIYNLIQKQKNLPNLIVDQEKDELKLIDLVTSSKRLGIFSIGGGVPRNNMQNVAPLIEIITFRTNLKLKEVKYSYGCRIAPDEVYLGHLSGCTYSEGVSWRKMDPKGKFAEIKSDATLILPFYVWGLKEILVG
jgi:deoxyhypusine synthase